MAIAVFPGSFDPPTNGHVSIISRAQKFFEKLDVVIAANSCKHSLFTIEERFDFLCEIAKPFPNVNVHICDELIAEYAKKTGASVLLRGVRNSTDFSYEFELSMINAHLNKNLETIFIPSEQKYLLVKSSVVKELAKYGSDISNLVPDFVANAIVKKMCRR